MGVIEKSPRVSGVLRAEPWTESASQSISGSDPEELDDGARCDRLPVSDLSGWIVLVGARSTAAGFFRIA